MTTHCSSAGHTDVGKVRRRNEDAILVRDDLGLWVVADGLGGHAAGHYASSLIVERLGALTRHDDVFDFVEAIEDSLLQVNTELRAAALAQHVDVIGSTVAMVVHDPRFVLCGWVGDSRVYVHEHGEMSLLTHDHVDGGPVDVTQFGRRTRAHTPGGVLTRAIGAESALHIDWVIGGSRPGMQFLLCSDGVNKELSDEELQMTCNAPGDPQSRVDRVFELALAGAARDNISAVFVRLDAS